MPCHWLLGCEISADATEGQTSETEYSNSLSMSENHLTSSLEFALTLV